MNRFTRRFFIGGCASAGAFAAGRMFAAPSFNLSKVNFRMGVVSDVHIRDPKSTYTTEAIIKAFEYFRDNGADAVMVAGDIADTGRVHQLKYFADAWYKVFPADKAPDGRRVEKLFVYGNHDYWGMSKEAAKNKELLADIINSGPGSRARVWNDCFNEKYEPVWIKDVKGYKIIGCHWGYGGMLKDFFASHANELKGGKPFFYTQHAHPRDTCFGSWSWGRDGGESTRALTPFPNAVAFSGHSHYPLTDERTVWQGAFTSINTSSMRYSSQDYSLRDNLAGNSCGYRGWKRPTPTPNLNTSDGKQGMLVEVGDEGIVIRRREFTWGESLGDDWVIPSGSDRPFEYARRKRTRKAPAFSEGQKITVKPVNDKAGKKAFIDVTIPHAASVDGCRVFEYEVASVIVQDDVEMTVDSRRVAAADYHLPPKKSDKTTLCRIPVEALPPQAMVRFDVRALECFGKKSEPLSSAPFKI